MTLSALVGMRDGNVTLEAIREESLVQPIFTICSPKSSHSTQTKVTANDEGGELEINAARKISK